MSVLPLLATVARNNVPDTGDAIDYIKQWIAAHLRDAGKGGASTLDPPEIRRGRIKNWGAQNTFGFVIDSMTDEEFFVHRSTQLPDLWESFQSGESVLFEVFTRKDGKTQATILKLAE